jgi:hypothetical protein
MSIHTEDNDIIYADSLDDFKTEGYTPIPCWSVLQLYELKGRTTTLVKDNLVYIAYTYYVVYDTNVKRYYKRLGRAYPISDLLFYLGGDVAIDNLLRFVADKNLTILMSAQQVESVSECLKRLYKAYFNEEGKLDYRLYIKILELSLKLEDFSHNQKNITGYRTVINQMEEAIRDLWAKAKIPKI